MAYPSPVDEPESIPQGLGQGEEVREGEREGGREGKGLLPLLLLLLPPLDLWAAIG